MVAGEGGGGHVNIACSAASIRPLLCDASHGPTVGLPASCLLFVVHLAGLTAEVWTGSFTPLPLPLSLS